MDPNNSVIKRLWCTRAADIKEQLKASAQEFYFHNVHGKFILQSHMEAQYKEGRGAAQDRWKVERSRKKWKDDKVE